MGRVDVVIGRKTSSRAPSTRRRICEVHAALPWRRARHSLACDVRGDERLFGSPINKKSLQFHVPGNVQSVEQSRVIILHFIFDNTIENNLSSLDHLSIFLKCRISCPPPPQ